MINNFKLTSNSNDSIVLTIFLVDLLKTGDVVWVLKIQEPFELLLRLVVLESDSEILSDEVEQKSLLFVFFCY